MKRISVLLFVVLLPLCASAQDIIVKKDGTIVKATVTKVSETEVEYRNFGSTSERMYTLKTSSIQTINYEDGTVEKFSVQEQALQAQDVQERGAQEPKNRKVGPDPEANRNAIEAVNSSVASYDKNKPDKKAYYSILKVAVAPQSVLVSDELSISAETGCIYELEPGSRKSSVEFDSYYGLWQKNLTYRFWGNSKPAIRFNVTNRTGHTLYLDLGNTFLSIGGQTVPYYVPGAQSTTSTSGKGAGVNLGAVAGALGVGGALGTLASGVTVGGGNSTSTNNIVYNQRVIAVAPFSRVSLEAQIIEDGSLIVHKEGYPAKIFYPEPITQGQKVEFSEQDSPLKLRFYLAYSSAEDCDRLKSMEAGFYGQSICGFGSASGGYSAKFLNFPAESMIVISYLSAKR